LPKKRGKVKFLADECLGLPTIALLLDAGFSVLKAKEAGLGGKPDFEILRWAIKSRRILITEDTDFGNIVLYPPRLHHGIILLRFRHSLEAAVHNTLLSLLRELKPKDFKKTLIIVDNDKYRLRKE
jgi:predicted nuclease of predicted toxin-antitoxin system